MTQHNIKIKSLKESCSFNAHPERVKAPLFQNSSFFDPKDLVQVKYEMLRRVSIDGESKTETAALFGVSRPTFYEAESAFIEAGLAGLLPRQRGPKGAHKIDTQVMAFIETCISENQRVKAKKLAELIQARFSISVHPRSIERAIVRKKKSNVGDN